MSVSEEPCTEFAAVLSTGAWQQPESCLWTSAFPFTFITINWFLYPHTSFLNLKCPFLLYNQLGILQVQNENLTCNMLDSIILAQTIFKSTSGMKCSFFLFSLHVCWHVIPMVKYKYIFLQLYSNWPFRGKNTRYWICSLRSVPCSL